MSQNEIVLLKEIIMLSKESAYSNLRYNKLQYHTLETSKYSKNYFSIVW